MLLKELMEATPKKTAVVAWGRMNPPTIGHQKVIDVVKQYAQKFMGDPILFLSKTQKPKTDPLSFAEKLHFASEMFSIKVDRNTSVKTIIQMFQQLQGQGYDNVILVAGSDRVQQYQDLIDKYNNKPDTKGEIPFKFANAKVVSSGERDPDAEGVAGMSSSKVKKLAAEGKFEDWKDETDQTQPGFKSSVPGNETLAKQMYNRVRQGMGLEVNEIMGFATRTPKRNVVKRRPPEPEELSVADKIKKRRAMANKVGVDKAFKHDSLQKQEAAGVGIVTKQNTTKDVKKGTLKKMMKAYKLI
jgi:hypothetical protein